MRKAIEDLGYTTVGLGVLALQEIRVRRRETRQCVAARLRGVQRRVDFVTGTVRALIDPVTDRLPRPAVPSLLSRALDTGRAQVDSVLRRRSPAEAISPDGTPAAAA